MSNEPIIKLLSGDVSHVIPIGDESMSIGMVLSGWSVKPYVGQSFSQSISWSVDQSVSQSVRGSVGQSVSQPVNKLLGKSVSQPVSQSVSRSVN